MPLGRKRAPAPSCETIVTDWERVRAEFSGREDPIPRVVQDCDVGVGVGVAVVVEAPTAR